MTSLRQLEQSIDRVEADFERGIGLRHRTGTRDATRGCRIREPMQRLASNRRGRMKRTGLERRYGRFRHDREELERGERVVLVALAHVSFECRERIALDGAPREHTRWGERERAVIDRPSERVDVAGPDTHEDDRRHEQGERAGERGEPGG